MNSPNRCDPSRPGEFPRKAERFITVYHPIAGWKAVMYWLNPDQGGFWEPWDTSPVAFSTREQAITWARVWGRMEGVEVRLPGEERAVTLRDVEEEDLDPPNLPSLDSP